MLEDMLERLKKDFVKILSDDLLLLNIRKMLDNYHSSKVKEIIEKNTDIYSVFHYGDTYLLGEIDGISYYYVEELASEKKAVINSNKEFIIPFDYYTTRRFEITEDNNITCYYNHQMLTYDLEGKLINEKYKKLKQEEIPSYIQKQFMENKFCEENIDIISYIINKMVNYPHIVLPPELEALKYTLTFINNNFNTVTENTKKLEQSIVEHSVFDYEASGFFTNGRNKRYFTLMDNVTHKIGIVNFKGDLITPFIYDWCVFCSTEYIGVRKDSKYGLLDCLGNIFIEPISDAAIEFKEMLATIKQDGKYGFIDYTGKVVIPVIYDDAQNFRFSKALVKLNEEEFYINRKGERVE